MSCKDEDRKSTFSARNDEGRKSALSAKNDDSDWSDIDTDAEDEQGTEPKRLRIDLKENEEVQDSEVQDSEVQDSEVQDSEVQDSEVKDDAEDKQQVLKTSSGRVVKRTSSSLPSLGRKSKTTKTLSVAGSSCGGSARKKNTKPRSSKLTSMADVPKELMTSCEAEIFHSRLESAAKHLRLNRTQVKSVIRKLVESPDLYNLILEKAGDKPETEISVKSEPRITRKVAKQVVETGGTLNWFLDKVSKTPKKVGADESAALLNVDFPDDESDQEYDPLKDPEALEALSDDDSVATATPTSSVAKTDVSLTPMSEGRLLDRSDLSIVSTSENKLDTFKRPLEASKAVRSLNFDQVTNDSGHPSMSPRLTRSMASFKKVTIEELDSKFIPCDITPGMYDNYVDDYTVFLAETYGQPVDIMVDDAEAETDPDPDFVYQESEELKDVQDEFENNRSTKISQKEVDELMQELFEAYEIDKEENNMTKKHRRKDYLEAERPPVESVVVYEEPKPGLTPEQSAVVAQQMRQHIQLLTQMALLSSNEEQLNYVHSDCKEMLSELVGSSFLKPYSMFAQDNLFPSLSLLDDWQKSSLQASEVGPKSGKEKLVLTKEFMDFVGNSTIILYPELLPTCALQTDDSKMTKQALWSQYEDNLLAIGLERYDSESPNENRTSFTKNAAQYIVNNRIVANKSVLQVKVRLKNKRCTKRRCDAIGYYLQHKKAPPLALSSLVDYNPSNVVAPKYAQMDHLPPIWQAHFTGKPFTSSTSTPKAVKKEANKSTPVMSEPQHIVHFSPTKMTFTFTTSEAGTNMTSFTQSPLKKADRFRPLAIRPGSVPSSMTGKFAKSPLKKERDRLLKKYSPMKKRSKLKMAALSNKIKEEVKHDSPRLQTIEETLAQMEGDGDQIPEVDKNVVISDHMVEPRGHIEVVTVSETATQITILDEAIQECGIGDDGHEHYDVYEEEQHYQCNNQGDHECDVDHDQEVDMDQDLDPVSGEHDQEHLIDIDPCDYEPIDPTSANYLQHPSSKRKNRQQREAEMTLQLLEPEVPSEAAIRKEQEALELVVAAKETLNHDQMMQFFEKVVLFKNDPIRAFSELHSICLGHPDLQEMLLDLLSPEEALTIGEEVHFQHSLRTQMKSFFHKVRMHYANQPSIHTRILKEIATVLSDPVLGVEDLKVFASKLFKSNHLLHQEFIALFPKMPYPESLLPDCERIDCSDDDDDDDPDISGSEPIDVPVLLEESSYGGDNCPCSCHPAVNTAHCIHCSLKFINGKVYSRGDGKFLRPVRIFYPNGDNPLTRSKKSGRSSKRPRKLRSEFETVFKASDDFTAATSREENAGDNLSVQDVKMDI